MSDTSFYAHGKLLLTSEYFVLDGAKAIALPTKLGQSLHITKNNEHTINPKLDWESYDVNQDLWMRVSFDLGSFDIISNEGEDSSILQNILRTAREMNPDFLSQPHDRKVRTELEFSRKWGLGSSSTLIAMIAKWAGISPFGLLENTIGGSGYDIACADAEGAIAYQKINGQRTSTKASFNPDFKGQLYFVYLNKKKCSRQGIASYKEKPTPTKSALDKLETIVTDILNASDLKTFETSLKEHEKLVADHMSFKTVQDDLFPDYWGAVKSLGAWGGDFVICTSDRDYEATRAYFEKRGYQTVIKYKDLILGE